MSAPAKNRTVSLPEVFLVVGIVAVVAGGMLAALGPGRRLLAARAGASGQAPTCLSNLRQIGQATMMYVQDSDGAFPAAWGSCTGNWNQRLAPYVKSAAVWKCPLDNEGEAKSYGTNGLISGAFVMDDCATQKRSPLWQDSKRLADIQAPARVVWAGDTTKVWRHNPPEMWSRPAGDLGKYAAVFTDWMRSTDAPHGGKDLRATVAWYRDFLRQDYTDYRGVCPNPGLYGCKGPAYRHGRTGPGTGTANVIYCDGHAAGVPFGALTVENIFPQLTPAAEQVAALPTIAPPFTAAYTILNVGTLGGPKTYHGGGINDKGQVVGTADTAHGGRHAFLWERGRITDLGTLDGGSGSNAAAINDAGQVVGDSNGRACLWQHGKMVGLKTPPGFTAGAATAINGKGQITGRAYSPGASWWSAPSHAILWENGKARDLGVPPGCLNSRAYGINDRGQVVGWALTKEKRTRAVLWDRGKWTDLGTFPDGTVSDATAINDAGAVIGDADRARIGHAPENMRAVLWRGGRLVDLGKYPTATYCKAVAINNRGEVIGDDTVDEAVPPFVWDAAHGLRNLRALIPRDSGWFLQRVLAINDHGQILGWGDDKDHVQQVFLMTPAAGDGHS